MLLEEQTHIAESGQMLQTILGDLLDLDQTRIPLVNGKAEKRIQIRLSLLLDLDQRAMIIQDRGVVKTTRRQNPALEVVQTMAQVNLQAENLTTTAVVILQTEATTDLPDQILQEADLVLDLLEVEVALQVEAEVEEAAENS